MTVFRAALPSDIVAAASAAAFERCITQGQMARRGAILEFAPELVTELIAGRPGQVAREYFGGEVIVPLAALHIRHFAVKPDPDEVLPFHQDITAFPRDWKVLTAWTLLYPDGSARCPKLQLVRAPVDAVLPLEEKPSHPSKAWMETSHAAVEQLVSRHGTWTPEVGLGDVVMYDQFALSRTLYDKPTRPCLALECRFVPATDDVLAAYAGNGQTALRLSEGELARFPA